MSESKDQSKKPILAGTEDDSGTVTRPFLMGIDLGTSRSSITAMSGVRKTVESYVGYPRDAVSRKLLGADIVFGKAALDNRLSLDLYRPLEKGVIKHTNDTDEKNESFDKNIQAVAQLFKHLINLADPGRDDVLYGVVGVPAQATKKNKAAMLEATKGILDSVMIVSEPFTVAYGLGSISDVLVIDIGAGTTDLCRMHGTVPSDEDQISLTIAGDAVDAKLLELIKASYPKAQITQTMCKRFKENYGFVTDAADPIKVDIPVDGKPTSHDITKELHDACNILVTPILESIHKLVSSFDPEFQEKIRNNIILSGGGGLMRGLNKKIEDGLDRVGGGKVTVVEEPMFAGSNGALQLAIDMPREYWQQLR